MPSSATVRTTCCVCHVAVKDDDVYAAVVPCDHDSFHYRCVATSERCPQCGGRLDDFVWEVKAVLGHRRRAGWTQYLVQWRGFSDDESTWVDEEDFGTAAQLQVLRVYKVRHGLWSP